MGEIVNTSPMLYRFIFLRRKKRRKPRGGETVNHFQDHYAPSILVPPPCCSILVHADTLFCEKRFNAGIKRIVKREKAREGSTIYTFLALLDDEEGDFRRLAHASAHHAHDDECLDEDLPGYEGQYPRGSTRNFEVIRAPYGSHCSRFHG